MYKYLFGMLLCLPTVISTVPNYDEKSWSVQVGYIILYPLPVGDFIYQEYVRNQEGE